MMDAGLLAQYVVVGLAVMASLVYVIGSRFPGAVRRWRGRIALRLVGLRWASAQAVGRRIAPAPRVAACGGCGGCSS